MDILGQNVPAGDDAGANGNADDKGDIQRQKNDIQREMVMIESDYRKKILKKDEIKAAIRKLKKEEDRLKVEVDLKNIDLKKVEFEIIQMEAEVARLKKKLNLL